MLHGLSVPRVACAFPTLVVELINTARRNDVERLAAVAVFYSNTWPSTSRYHDQP